MSDTNITNNIATEAKVDKAAEQRNKEPKSFIWLAVGSLIVTIIAWIVATINGGATVCISAIAIVLGAFALKSHRALTRNISITSIIAAGILLVVVASFLIVINMGLKSV
jgi:hypothetical protein